MRATYRLLELLPCFALCSVLGCAAEKEVLTSDPTAIPRADAGEPIVVTAQQFGMDARTPAPIDAAPPAVRADAQADAAPVVAEACDGVDNDGNGTIDDVDVGRDGICDCLLIATLGKSGGSNKSTVFGTWLSARSDNGADDLADQTLTEELLNRYHVIVAQDIHDQRLYSEAEVTALENWVRAGGGLLTLTGYASSDERTNANAILTRFGISYLANGILARGGASKTVPVRTWTPHPVTTGVSAVGVDNGYPVQGGTTLASEGGFDLLKAAEVGSGHVLAWGDEWITYDSEWQNDTDYQVEQLWLNMIKWLTAARVCQVPPVYL